MSEVHQEAPAQATPAHWSASFAAEDLGFIQNRGWDKLEATAALTEAIKAYRNAAKMVGAPPEEMVRFPKTPDAPEWAAIWKKLGKPDDATGYDFSSLATPEKPLDEGLVAMVREAAFGAHLPPEAATKILGAVLQHQSQAAKMTATEAQVRQDAERERLDQMWGGRKETNKFIAQGAAAKAGITADALAALESVKGYADTMQFFLDLGLASGEGRYITGETARADGAISVDQAKAQLKEMMADSGFRSKWAARDVEAVRKFDEITRRIAEGNLAERNGR